MITKNTTKNHNKLAFSTYDDGLTKREYFAVMAIQGLLTRVPNRHNGETDLGVLECKRIAEEAIIIADELLNKLSN